MNPERTALEQLCAESGAAGFGVCRLSDIRTDDFLLPRGLLDLLPTAVSLAMRVSPAVLESLEGRPNQLYEHHYRQVNFALDRLTFALASHIQALGRRALPIPASQLVDWQNQRGHLSHKRIAVAAGLGWLGRNNLLVTPGFGSQVRLATVLTDLELDAGTRDMAGAGHNPIPSAELGSCPKPRQDSCGSCRACMSACPAHAIGDTPADFDHQSCFAMLKEFQSRRYVSQYICGLCVRACAGSAGRPPTAGS
jgi:epoxyqueuosine reductase